jgi:hypothetical protein
MKGAGGRFRGARRSSGRPAQPGTEAILDGRPADVTEGTVTFTPAMCSGECRSVALQAAGEGDQGSGLRRSTREAVAASTGRLGPFREIRLVRLFRILGNAMLACGR